MSMTAKTLGVSRSNLYKQREKKNRSRRYNKAEDADLLLLIKEIISTRATYGYRRVQALLNKNLAALGRPPVNHKRVYRIMRQNNVFGNTTFLLLKKQDAR